MTELNRIILELANEEPFPETNYDHSLIGNYAGYRKYHIAGDCPLVYKIIDDQIFFARIGAHADIFE